MTTHHHPERQPIGEKETLRILKQTFAENLSRRSPKRNIA
jgi:hypothetical protein